MNILLDHLWAWSLLLGFLAFLVYSLLIIGKEGSNFKQECYYVGFRQILLPIPKWWSQENISEHEIHFTRDDTHYDWRAQFCWIPEKNDISLTQVFDSYLEKNSLYFDAEVIVETHPEHLFLDGNVLSNCAEFIRVEGMASQQTDRIYIDMVFMRFMGESGYFHLESKSSVLNGGIEGPYFEEALKNTQWAASGV